jgi:hypothetical protein
MHGTVSRQISVIFGAREGAVPGFWRLAAGITAVLAVMLASPASPQGNIDAGKTPAQIFADTCSNCHRRPQELKRASVGFLRQHYTPGAQEAAAMASYLASVPNDPRAGRDRGKGTPDREKAKPQPQQQAHDRANDRPKQQQGPKAKRPAEVAKSAAEGPAEAPPEPIQEAPPVPKLEPFEE